MLNVPRAFQKWIARSESWRSQPSRSRYPLFCAHRDGDEDSDSLGFEAPPAERSGVRRLVILGAQTFDEDSDEGSDHHSSDTESIDSWCGTSDMEGEVEVVPLPEPPVKAVAVSVERFVGSFQWLAGVDLEVVFKELPCHMKSIPGFMKGRTFSDACSAHRDRPGTFREGCHADITGLEALPLLPRLLLHKPPRGGLVPKKQLQHRFAVFTEGDWASLLIASAEHAIRATQASSRRSRRRDHENLEASGARAEALIHMGQLSAARQALEGAAVAPGTRETLNALQNPVRDTSQFSATPFRSTSFMLHQRNSSLWKCVHLEHQMRQAWCCW